MADDDIKLQPFSYLTLTYLEWLNEMDNNDLFAGKPKWLKTLLAGRADVIASYIDARANNNMFHSMYTKQNVYSFAGYLDYIPSTPQCASGYLQVTLKTGTSLPATISKSELIFQTAEAVGGSPVVFSAVNDFVFTSLTGNVPVKEGRQYSDIIPYSCKGESFEEFAVTRDSLVNGSTSISINGQTWTEVEKFFDSKETDRHFRIIYGYSKSVRIRCGNGVYGAKFPVGYQPTVTGWYGGGTRGNISAGKITVYSGTDARIMSVTNTAKMAGGAGEESIDKVKTLAPILVAAQDRCVSKPDFWAFSLKFGGISRAYIQPNYFGLLSTRVQIVPNGGGEASSILKSALTTYLKAKTLMSSIFIQVDTADYQAVDVIMEILTSEGYEYSSVLPFVRLGTLLVLTECLAEIKEAMKSEGIKSTVEYINSLWSFSFDYNNEVTLKQIKNMINAASVMDWGKYIYTSEFYKVIEHVDGVESISVLSPANMITVATDKIVTPGTFTLWKRINQKDYNGRSFFGTSCAVRVLAE